jgi:hypothetical protein
MVLAGINQGIATLIATLTATLSGLGSFVARILAPAFLQFRNEQGGNGFCRQSSQWET